MARLASWVMSHVLVQERDFDGSLVATDKAIVLAPYDVFMHSSLMMVLCRLGGRIRRFSGQTKLRHGTSH